MEGEQTSTSRYSTSKPVANSGFQMCGGFSSRKFASQTALLQPNFGQGESLKAWLNEEGDPAAHLLVLEDQETR